MLANTHSDFQGCGALAKDVHKPAAFLNELVDFIEGELPRWRDRADRPPAESETVLTSQLCAHLNGASRKAEGWDILQFRVEEPDAVNKGRRLDLVPSPSGTTINIEGRRHTEFDPLLPIECKRLPTPRDNSRDEREYVFSQHSTTGGIQRFKAGLHGATHTVGAMIGYLQSESMSVWVEKCSAWVRGLVGSEGWREDDILVLDREDASLKTAALHSSHGRSNNLPNIELRHLWIAMN